MNRFIEFMGFRSGVPEADMEAAVVIACSQGRLANDQAVLPNHQIATNDFEAVLEFLDMTRAQRSASTFRSYKTQVRRLCIWCFFYQRKRLSDLEADDFVQFKKWLSAPPPNQINIGGVALFKGNKNSTGLSSDSVKLATDIVKSMFNWWLANGYLVRSFFADYSELREGRSPAPYDSSKSFDRAELSTIIASMRELRPEGHFERARRDRAIAMMQWVICVGLRRNEIAKLNMVQIEWNPESKSYWWRGPVQRGEREHRPIPDYLAKEFEAYCSCMGLTHRPGIAEQQPLPVFTHINNTSRAISSAMVYEELRHFFALVACEVERKGGQLNASLVDKLRNATPGWLRHSMFAACSKSSINLTQQEALTGVKNSIRIYCGGDSPRELADASNKVASHLGLSRVFAPASMPSSSRS